MATRDDLAERVWQVAAAVVGDVSSPCVSVCRINEVTGLCEGCRRTLGEITAWSSLSDAGKREVWRQIGQRALPLRTGEPMKQITFFLDFISPYSYLAFEQLPQALQGLGYAVEYRPALFAGMLKQHGQLGPAEIAPKRDWTYRQVLWLAHQHGIPMQMPALHPFNPLPLLRLALATGPAAGNGAGLANRYVCETIFRHVWRGGADAVDPQRLAALTALLQPARDPAGADVKAQLKANTEGAIARGVFGVPTYAVDDKLIWGFDSLAMLRAYLEGDAWFAGGDWEAAQRVGQGAIRAKVP